MKRNLYIPIDITLDFEYECPLLIKKYDDLKLKIVVFDKGIPKDLTGQTINLILKKSDGTNIEKTITDITLNILNIALDNQSTVCSGIVEGEVQITDAAGQCTTNTFTFNVSNALATDITIKSEDDIETLEDMRALIATYKEEITALGDSVQATEALINIKNYISNNLTELTNKNATANANIAVLQAENNRSDVNIPALKNENDNADDKLDKFRLYDTTNLIQQVQNNTASLSDMENIVNRYKGKKYVAVGDSITYGFVDNPYSKLVGQILGMNYVNMGVSGSLITVDPAKTDSIFERRSTIPTDADVISIFGGTNDFGHTVVDMGMFGDTTYNLGFYGTVYALCQWLLENRPNAKIFFITPLPRGGMNTENTFGYILEDYVNAIIDVCNYWSIPVLDFYHDSALSPLSNAIAAEYYDSNKLHPLQNGHNLLANKIIEFMRGI